MLGWYEGWEPTMMISRSNVNFLLVCCSMSSSSDSLDVSKFAEWEYPWEDISATNLWKKKTQSPDNHQKNTMTIIHCEKHPTLNFAYENPWMSLPFICLWKNVEQKSPQHGVPKPWWFTIQNHLKFKVWSPNGSLGEVGAPRNVKERQVSSSWVSN